MTEDILSLKVREQQQQQQQELLCYDEIIRQALNVLSPNKRVATWLTSD